MIRRLSMLLAAVCGISLSLHAQRPADWTQWRGPNRDGAAPFSVPQTWPERLTQKWKLEVGNGYATPLVIGNRVYVFARQGDNEVMMALDADTGKEIWKNAGYPAVYTMQSATVQHGPGPKSTPAFANGRLFTIGMTGVVTAWDAGTGKQVWQKPGDTVNMPQFTSHAFSPVVDRGVVIFHLGGNAGGAITAFDVNTGAEKWSWKGDGPGYGSPVVADIGGTRQVITITQKMLVGLDAATGAVLWERPWVSPNQTNSITPVVHGQNIIVSGNGDPTTEFSITKRDGKWVVDTVWRNEEIPDAHEQSRARGRHAVWHVDAELRPVLRGRRQERQDTVAVRRAAGRQRGDGHSRTGGVEPGERRRARRPARESVSLRTGQALQACRRRDLDAGRIRRQSRAREGRDVAGVVDSGIKGSGSFYEDTRFDARTCYGAGVLVKGLPTPFPPQETSSRAALTRLGFRSCRRTTTFSTSSDRSPFI